MAVRQDSVLKQHGWAGSLVEYRAILERIKDAEFLAFTDEELTYTRDEADAFCDRVRREAELPGLPRTFILRSLIGMRKHALKV